MTYNETRNLVIAALLVSPSDRPMSRQRSTMSSSMMMCGLDRSLDSLFRLAAALRCTHTNIWWMNTCLCCCCVLFLLSLLVLLLKLPTKFISTDTVLVNLMHTPPGGGGIQHHFWTEVSQSIHVNCEHLCLAHVIFWSILIKVNQPEMLASTNYNVKLLQMSASGSD